MTADPQLIATALRLHQSGQFDQAQAMYRQALAADPENPDVLSLLGAVCINLSQWDEAAAHLDRALVLNPDHYAAHDNRGVLLARQNRFAEAVVNFQRAVAINPHAATTHLNLGNALLRNGQLDEAIKSFSRAIEIDPSLQRSHMELADALKSQNRLAEAVTPLAAIARLRPQDPRAHFELALALGSLGRVDEALACYRQVLRLDPQSAAAYVNLANLCAGRKEFDEAIGLFDRAIALRPNFAEAYVNLASALTQQQRFAEAAAALERAIALNPEMSEAYNNLGIVRQEEGQFAKAVASYEQALTLRSDNPDTWYNLGIAHLKQRRIASALEHFDQALELRPDYAEAHHNRGAALLLSENYAQGLEEYEWRFGSRDFPQVEFRWPRWDGSPLAGRTIVLCGEQGLGDTIQFVRYAERIKRQAARVIVECPDVLRRLLARTPGVDQWISLASPAPKADCCAPLLSLPFLLGTTRETIPADVPYVLADPALEAVWRVRLSEFESTASRFKLGITWQGNPKCPGDNWRSIPLNHYAPLAQVNGVRLFNLQKGPGLDQLAAVANEWSIVDFGTQVDSTAGAFMDTAAIMKNLDLVITSDTATAHVAGALGVPVWLALQYVPDWRWGLEGDTCPWYPTMRLFRQSQWGDWAGVLQRMASELTALVPVENASSSGIG